MFQPNFHLFFTVALALLSITRPSLAGSNAAPLLPFNYDTQTVRGVNLGGWFVLEPWITPSIFNRDDSVVDEYTYTQSLGKSQAQAALNDHWSTWITASDFIAIAAAGLNHVRIPIGYWAVLTLPGDPYVQGQLPYLDQAIQWARASNLHVLLDLHGVPGSQNGFDNSGRRGRVNWQSGSTLQQTITALQALTEHYINDTDVITAIELINEPLPTPGSLTVDQVKSYYTAGYTAVRRSSGPQTAVVIHDAFQQDLPNDWNGFMTPSTGHQNVILDTHQYQIFTPQQVSRSPTDHVAAACALGPQLAQLDKWTMVGEWTGAQTDCAKWLNGYGRGARYDGSFGPGSWRVGDCAGKHQGSVGGRSADDKANLRRFIEAQLDAYGRRSGWVFWTWKTESAPEWHLKDLLAEGLFPQPLEQRRFPGQCRY